LQRMLRRQKLGCCMSFCTFSQNVLMLWFLKSIFKSNKALFFAKRNELHCRRHDHDNHFMQLDHQKRERRNPEEVKLN
jgi:hypothetical protein